MKSFYSGKKILVTGHTGFKGSWLSKILVIMGADVIGYSLPPELKYPGFYTAVGIEKDMRSVFGDIRDLSKLRSIFKMYRPEIVFHLAAQAIVRCSYKDPVGTLSTNIMGTVNVLEAARETPSVQSIIIITSDKSYENKEWIWGYRENDEIGGKDPYSSSKGCAEIVTSAYRRSYFSSADGPFVATARAGNVIGGGDWGEDRLVPDIFRAIKDKKDILLRNPNAVRPWQHVLEPLRGYLLLAKFLWFEKSEYASAWNFGPSLYDTLSVLDLTNNIVRSLGLGKIKITDSKDNKHEAQYLSLDFSKAYYYLKWHPMLSLDETINMTVDFYKCLIAGKDDIEEYAQLQILRYMKKINW